MNKHRTPLPVLRRITGERPVKLCKSCGIGSRRNGSVYCGMCSKAHDAAQAIKGANKNLHETGTSD